MLMFRSPHKTRKEIKAWARKRPSPSPVFSSSIIDLTQKPQGGHLPNTTGEQRQGMLRGGSGVGGALLGSTARWGGRTPGLSGVWPAAVGRRGFGPLLGLLAQRSRFFSNQAGGAENLFLQRRGYAPTDLETRWQKLWVEEQR